MLKRKEIALQDQASIIKSQIIKISKITKCPIIFHGETNNDLHNEESVGEVSARWE